MELLLAPRGSCKFCVSCLVITLQIICVTSSHVLHSCCESWPCTPRDDIISIPTCGDKALLAAFAEQDGEFYGFGLEDLETHMVIAEDSDEEDSGSENELDLNWHGGR